ncbi:hypothetical protein QYF36_017184 [Acer negundo]|nr:hypothetical protein QYF36_017184 [Acer negundo]
MKPCQYPSAAITLNSKLPKWCLILDLRLSNFPCPEAQQLIFICWLQQALHHRQMPPILGNLKLMEENIKKVRMIPLLESVEAIRPAQVDLGKMMFTSPLN